MINLFSFFFFLFFFGNPLSRETLEPFFGVRSNDREPRTKLRLSENLSSEPWKCPEVSRYRAKNTKTMKSIYGILGVDCTRGVFHNFYKVLPYGNRKKLKFIEFSLRPI